MLKCAIKQEGLKSQKVSLYLLSKKSNSVEYLHNLYSVYLKKQNINESKILIKKLLQIDAEHYEAQRDLGYIEFIYGKINFAQDILEKIVDDKSNDPFALNILGLTYLKNGLVKKAKKDFKEQLL